MEYSPTGRSCFYLIPNFSIVSRYKILMLLPPSINTLEKRAARLSVAKVASRTRVYEPGEGITSGWSALLQLIGFSDKCMNSGVLEATACTSCSYCRLLRLSSATLLNTT